MTTPMDNPNRQPPPNLADFAGKWSLSRRIIDALGPGGEFTGTAVFTPVSAGMDYAEQGVMRWAQGPQMQAGRRYKWRETVGMIAVLFDNGKQFHTFDPAASEPEARHDCAPDLYQVRYDFTHWPDWTQEWRVTGPRKDYRMHTAFARR